MPTPARPDFRILRGWSGGLILRPWFDWLAVRAVASWYLPLSRAWAAGAAARGSVGSFEEALGPGVANWSKAASVLSRLDARRRRAEEASAAWESAFFGDADVNSGTLAEIEARRLSTSERFMTARASFLPVRRKVASVAWQIAPPVTVRAKHAARLESAAAAFSAPSDRPVEKSRTIERNGRVEFWIRMESPVLGDTAWARVFCPASGPVHGTIVSLHGVFMEQDMWAMADPVTDLVAQGFCVIRPEGPGHGRRCPPGSYGGEPVLAGGILGFIETFEAWVAEVALWTRWARAEIGDRVGIAGISLGALTAQLVVSACGDWPADMRPDAALLITTTDDIVDGALGGSLTTTIGVEDHLWAAGWDRDELHRWAPLLEPRGAPALDPEKIVMALGDADTVTPFQGGRAFADRWAIPAENLLVGHQGHFSTALGLYRDPAPLHRLAALTR